MVTTVSLNFIRLLESQTPEKDVWINEPLTPSSETSLPENRALIVQTF